MSGEKSLLKSSMSSPSWYKSRLKSWKKPKVNTEREKCGLCGVPKTVTPSGLICFYCREYDDE